MFLYSVLLVLLVTSRTSLSLYCSRYPANTFTPKSPVDDNIAISISGNPQTYVLGQSYNISITAYNGLRFVSFMLVLEDDNGDSGYMDNLGRFEITDTVETRYSPDCINVVENTNPNPKTRVDVTWVAPERPGVGCVLLRATVQQRRDVWYMDDGGLTRRICEEIVDDVESQSVTLSNQPCCACDEARYDLIFEGLWSRNLHPKDFPTKGWITRFSDIVGASHKADYRFWEYGALATIGMQEFAEHGTSRILERDFNAHFKSGNIRTIIKARGPAFPNLSGRSVASVRVDSQHHFISLASKIEPSPDWIVGVTGLELCMQNCTWLADKVIYLYPTDVGTDAGPTYTSPTQPQVPAGVIRRMRSDYPNDPRSPFYDETGAPMKPLATLTVKRQRLYERLCEDDESNNSDVSRECATHPWSAWSECTVKCGEGRQYRARVYKQPEVARIYNCDVLMANQQNRTCFGSECGEANQPYNTRPSAFEDTNADLIDNPYGNDQNPVRAECALSAWGAWSACNTTCGEGQMVRRRQFLSTIAEQECQRAGLVNLYEYKTCFGRSCSGNVYDANGVETEQWGRDNQQLFNANAEHEYSESGGNNGDDVVPQEYDARYSNYNNQEGQEETPYNAQDGYSHFENNLEVADLSKAGEPSPFDTPFQYENRVQLANKNAGNSRRNQNSPSYSSTQRAFELVSAPAYCFEQLHIFTCLDAQVTGNFWFYHYCQDECMLYTSDTCDRNENKFTSLEMCEMRCRQPEVREYLKRKQLQDCQRSQLRADEHERPRRKGRRMR